MSNLLQTIITVVICLVALGSLVWSIFFRKKKGCNKADCSSCPQYKNRIDECDGCSVNDKSE